MKAYIVAGVALLLAGCVSTHMQQYIGRDIREVIVDSGPPVNTLDMGGGRRAFQFYWGGGDIIVPASGSGTATVIGNTVYASSVSYPGGVVHSEGCLITYFARQAEGSDAWIVTEIAYPKRVFC